MVSEQRCWAEWKPARGREELGHGGEVTFGLASVVIRYIPNLNNQTYRIKKLEDDSVWDIVDIPKEIGRREAIELICQWSGQVDKSN